MGEADERPRMSARRKVEKTEKAVIFRGFERREFIRRERRRHGRRTGHLE
jgi:hypothetical protein